LFLALIVVTGSHPAAAVLKDSVVYTPRVRELRLDRDR